MAAKRPASRRTVQKPFATADVDEPINLGSSDDVVDVETIPLFILDDVEYCIPKAPPASLVLQYLRAVRNVGPEVAGGILLEGMLTPEGYDALMNHSGLTFDQLESIILRVQRYTLGAAEKAGGVGAPLG